MKTKLTLFSIVLMTVLCSTKSISQNRYSQSSISTYTPMSQNEIMSVPPALQAKYNENQKYLYSLKKWILDLRTQIKEESFTNRLNIAYKNLSNIEDTDLARATTYLKKVENSIDEIITDYKIGSQHKNSTEILYETSITSEIPLRVEPNVSSSEIYLCPLNAKVYVHDKSGTLYYRVTVNGHTGWISKHFLN